jgi:hypothetical protein
MSTNAITRWLPLLGAAWLLGAACQKNEPAPAETTSTAPAVPAPAPEPVASAPAALEIPDADLAVPEDFEDEAEKEITVSNYKAELKALEKELEGPE